MRRAWDFVATWSLLLVLGAAAGLLWANLDPGSYDAVLHFVIWPDAPVGEAHYGTGGAEGSRDLTVAFLVRDVLMALFFALAGKEVWEAVALPGGALRGRAAGVPVVAAVGGMAAPAALYLGLAALLGGDAFARLAPGWAVPTATDIALSYVAARLVLGRTHPGVAFLLLLAIVDDALGLLVLAVFYPQGALAPLWLLLSLGAALGLRLARPWLPDGRLAPLPYALGGALSWWAFHEAGLHPALGLLPIVPVVPHAARDLGPFAPEEVGRTDLLDRMGHALHAPVQITLGLFGLVAAGVQVGAHGGATWLVLMALLVGKPFGILAATALAGRALGTPAGMGWREVLVVGVLAGTGFTVALFVAGVAFPADPATADAARMGALLSIAAAPLA